MKHAAYARLLVSILSISACTGQPTVSTTSSDTMAYFADLQAEYAGFQTQALTQNYLKRKVRHWLNINNGTAMVREMEFARYKHPELLTQMMNADDALCENSLALTEVQSFQAISPTFYQYTQGFSCVHSGEFNVSEDNSTEQHASPAVAMHNDGQFLVTWHSKEKNGGNYRIQAQRFLANGAPLAPAFEVSPSHTTYQYNSDAAFFDDGSFIIVWDRAEGNNGFEVYAQRYFADGTVNGTPFRVNTYTTNNQYAPAVSTSANGNFVITWDSGGHQDGSQRGIYARLYSDGGSTPNPVIAVNTITAGEQVRPDVAMAADGRFTITWMSTPSANADVVAQQFLADGTKTGGEFQVNTYTSNYQSEPAIDMSTDGRFVIAWTSYEQDGDEGGIFARRFNANGTPLGNELPINALTLHSQNSTAIAL